MGSRLRGDSGRGRSGGRRDHGDGAAVRTETDVGAIIHPFVQLCLLRMKPQDLPASGTLLALALIAHTAAGAAVATVSLGLTRALAAGVVDTALLCALTTGLLMLRALRERAVQTLTALAGAGAIIGLAAYPVSLWLHGAQSADGPEPALAVLLLAVLGWSLTVSAHILRHAISAPFYIGLLVSIVFYWISIRVLSSLFPLGV